MRAFYEISNDNLPKNINIFSSFEGFTALGYEMIPFKSVHLIPDLHREDIILGTIPTIHMGLRATGCKIPQQIDYPESLQSFLGRKIWTGVFGDLCDEFPHKIKWPVFVKPTKLKTADGKVVRRFRDLLNFEGLQAETPVYFSEVVNFVSEYRVFVCEKEILGISRYKGDHLIFPNPNRILNAISSFTDSPVAYSLDVGVTAENETLLVECNDFYSLGSYGLDSLYYAHGIEKRWKEMIKLESISLDTFKVSPEVEEFVRQSKEHEEKTRHVSVGVY